METKLRHGSSLPEDVDPALRGAPPSCHVSSRPKGAPLNLGELVGKGSSSEVYAISRTEVVKLYRPGFTRSDVETEAIGLRIAQSGGVPAPSVSDLIEIDNRYGIVLERIDGPRLSDYLQLRPWATIWAYRLYAELFAKIHSCGAMGLPSQRQLMLGEIKASGLDVLQQQTVIDRLSRLSDAAAVCLRDLAPTNILLSKRGPVVVDWESALSGNPIVDVALVKVGVEVTNASAPSLRRILRRACYHAFFARYLQLTGRRFVEITAWQLPVAAAKLARCAAGEIQTLTNMVRDGLAAAVTDSPQIAKGLSHRYA